MIVFGVTGSIGMGKSSVAKMFARMGAFVHDSDSVVHRTLQPGGVAFEEVAITFPECWDKKRHVIDRQVLADIVFDDRDKRLELEGIIHPYVRRSHLEFVKKHRRRGTRMVVLDIPLLFESGMQDMVDYTVCVFAPFHVQRARVLSRHGMSEERFLKIVRTQMPDVNKMAMTDFVVQTGCGFAYSYEQVRRIARTVVRDCAGRKRYVA